MIYPGTPIYVVNYSYEEVDRPKDVKENGTTVLASWSYADTLNAKVTYGTYLSFLGYPCSVTYELAASPCRADQFNVRINSDPQD